MNMTSHRHLHSPPAQPRRDALPAPPAKRAAREIDARFSALYHLAQDSACMFGSPLGPFELLGRSYFLPRFVYFGPQFSDASVRLAFLAGADGRDAAAVGAMLHFLEQLALAPDLGHGLNLAFFPLVNPSGFEAASSANAAGVDLATANWRDSNTPEIRLLGHDARIRVYDGWVRVETTAVEAITASVQTLSGRSPTASELGGSDVDDGFPLHWRASAPVAAGPLTLSEDLAIAPFELVLQFPAFWSGELLRESVAQVLKRLIVHYRATAAYGIHL